MMLLEKLIERQRRFGLTDGDFAAELGISRQLWQFTRTGRVRIGQKILAGTCRRFPDLIPEVLYFLGNDANKLTSLADKLA